MAVQKLTPVMIVDAIEPLLPFWEASGFGCVATVPHGDALGFVILVSSGGAELMLQSRASVIEDLGLADPPSVALYTHVDTLDDVPGEVLIARRTTFYGAVETWVWDPGRGLVGFAIPPAAPAE